MYLAKGKGRGKRGGESRGGKEARHPSCVRGPKEEPISSCRCCCTRRRSRRAPLPRPCCGMVVPRTSDDGNMAVSWFDGWSQKREALAFGWPLGASSIVLNGSASIWRVETRRGTGGDTERRPKDLVERSPTAAKSGMKKQSLFSVLQGQ